MNMFYTIRAKRIKQTMLIVVAAFLQVFSLCSADVSLSRVFNG